MSDPLLLRPEVVARDYLSCSRSKCYAMIAAGEVAGVVRLGGSVRVHRPTLEAWLAEAAQNEAREISSPRASATEGHRHVRPT